MPARLAVGALVVAASLGASLPAAAATPDTLVSTTCGATAALSPDAAVVTITYSRSEATVDADSTRRTAFTHCSTEVTFPAKAGYRVAVNKIDNRGFVKLPAGSQAFFRTSLTMGPPSAWWATNSFLHRERGEKHDDFTVTHSVPTRSLRWSACGKPATVNLHTLIFLGTSPTPREDAMASWDSTDLSVTDTPGTSLGALWQRC